MIFMFEEIVQVSMADLSSNVQSLFRDVMVCFVFDGPLDGGRLNKVI